MSAMDTEAERIRAVIAQHLERVLKPGQRVQVVDSGVRLRSRKFIGRLGRVVSGPVQWQNGKTYQVQLDGDSVERTMFSDEVAPAYGFDKDGRDLGKVDTFTGKGEKDGNDNIHGF